MLGGGLAIIAASGSSRALAVAGLAVFLTGFEYGFVSSLTLVSEAAPAARGRAIGLSSMFGTIARSAAVIASGQLYDASGMSGPVTWAAVTGSLALAMTLFTRLPHE